MEQGMDGKDTNDAKKYSQEINRVNPATEQMPLITISMYPGRTEKQKEEFAKAVTRSAVEILKTKENHVIVVFEENPKENWYMAGNPL